MQTYTYEKEEGKIVPPMNVRTLLDGLTTTPSRGLDPQRANAARDYVHFLKHAVKEESARNLSILLTAALNTTSRSHLRAIFLKRKGLQVLAAMLVCLPRSFHMTPILRLILSVLQHLEKLQVLRGASLACAALRFYTHDFSRALYDLTRHSNAVVQALAKTFQNLRFQMPRGHPLHSKCQHA